MIDDPGLPGDVFSHRNAFILGLVRQHRAGHDIADRPDARDRSAEVMRDLDLPARVGDEPDRVEA